jgi:hypothetical protein
MKVKYMLTVMAIVAITKNGFAQYSQDVVKFSTAQTGSTARIKALGNAQTAIGGDMSSISGNPAGLGFFTKSELSITPEFNNQNANANYLGQSNSASGNNLNLNNVSGVVYSRLNTPAGTNKGEGWLSLNYGASFNRTNDFYQNIYYGGNNTANSISNYYANLANAAGSASINGPNLQDWAYAHSLIDSYSNGAGGSTYLSNVFNSKGAPNSPVNQNNSITREGGETEFSLSMGANYSNKFYLGFGIGITSLRYNSINTFNEAGTASVLNSSSVAVNANYASSYTQSQATTGSGLNARFGFIYKPIEAIRFGATITTPTYYTINDDYAESLNTEYKSGINSPSPGGPTDYQLTYSFHTPLKVSGGVAVFVGQYGFITGDVEYLDYSSIRIQDADGYSAYDDNHDIKTLYRSTVNTHLGAEIKLDQLYLRGGYSIEGNPQRDYGSDIKTISGGLGYRFMNYYIDATYTNVQGSQTIFPYLVDTANPQANINSTYNNIFLTVGMRF